MRPPQSSKSAFDILPSPQKSRPYTTLTLLVKQVLGRQIDEAIAGSITVNC
ncbi:hypothetical protein [Nostoc sp.]